MDTIVTIKVVTSQSKMDIEESMARAFDAFYRVENVCSRFNNQSEISRLCTRIGTPVPVSPLLFEAIRFAREVADVTAGAFDPTVGNTLGLYGFNRHYLTGDQSTPITSDPHVPVSYLDIDLDEEKRTVLLRQPLVLDLGAVAKGLAVDLAVRELADYEGFFVDAGGDIFAGGLNEYGEPWTIGIRHPINTAEIISSLQLSNLAVCTSGSYERPSPVKQGIHHLINPRSGMSRPDILSCTVIAPYTMMADAFSTAAFILGPEQGIQQLELAGLDGILITPALEMPVTKEMRRYMI